MMTAQAIFLV